MPTQQDTRALGVHRFMKAAFKHGAESVTLFRNDLLAVDTGRSGASMFTVRLRTSSYPDWQDRLDDLGVGSEVVVLVNVREPDDFYVIPQPVYEQRMQARYDAFLDDQPDHQRPRSKDSKHVAARPKVFADYLNTWSVLSLTR